jgi:hypothetical protein
MPDEFSASLGQCSAPCSVFFAWFVVVREHDDLLSLRLIALQL